MESSPLLPRKKSKTKDPFTSDVENTVWEDFKDLSIMAFQVSLATVARIALTSVDAAFLGHLGVQELAAASLAQVWTTAPLMGVWAGASALITLCGQAWGAGNRVLTGVWLQFGLIVTTVMSIPVFIWYWCIGYVLEYSTDDARVVELGTRFSRILSFSILPSLIYACCRQYFQAMGILIPTTIVGAVSIVIAVAANSVLIYGIGSFQGFGFDGSPWSTVVASWFQPLALITYCIVIKKYHLQAWGGWRRDALTIDRTKQFISIAGPISCNSFVSNLANSLISLIAAQLGSKNIAANAVISGLWGVLWALFWGYGCATQVRVANYLGAGKPHVARRIAFLGLISTAVTVTFLASVTLYLKDDLYRVYTNEQELLALCYKVMPIFVTSFVLESFEMLCSAVLTGMSNVKIIFWTSSIATWCINLPVSYFGAITMGYGLEAIWMGILCMEVFKLCIYTMALHHVDWNFMADRAVNAMEKAPESTLEEVEVSAVNYITAIVGSQPSGYISGMPEATPPLLSTPHAREKEFSKVSEGIRRRATFI